MQKKSDFNATIAPKEVIMTRTIDAPRELVFDAFTKKEHLEKWFGPHGFRTTAETEPREGGAFRIVMHSTDALPPEFAGDYPMSGIYKEFKRPEKLVFTNNIIEHSEEWKATLRKRCKSDNDAEVFSSTATLTFEEKNGKTLVTLRSTFASDNIRDGYIETGMNQGWAESFDRLENYLENAS